MFHGRNHEFAVDLPLKSIDCGTDDQILHIKGSFIIPNSVSSESMVQGKVAGTDGGLWKTAGLLNAIPSHWRFPRDLAHRQTMGEKMGNVHGLLDIQKDMMDWCLIENDVLI